MPELEIGVSPVYVNAATSQCCPARVRCNTSVARFQEEFNARRYGWFAVEERGYGQFVGFAGLDDVDAEMPFTGVEIGWRPARPPGTTAAPPKAREPFRPSASKPSNSRISWH